MRTEENYKIRIWDGVVYLLEDNEWRMLGAPEADRISRANGEHYAEYFVKKYTGKTLELDREKLTIIQKEF